MEATIDYKQQKAKRKRILMVDRFESALEKKKHVSITIVS